jgi:hypothetical protein
MILGTLEALELLRERGIRTTHIPYRSDAHVDVALECSENLMLGRTIELRSAGRCLECLSPVDTSRAETIADEFCAKLGLDAGAEATRALADAILGAEDAFAIEGVERLVLDPVRLHDGTYDVICATIEASRALPVRRRTLRHTRNHPGQRRR